MQQTDANGNFTLSADGGSFTGAPGVTAYVDLVVMENGSIAATSMDESGNLLSQVKASAAGACTSTLSFQDGGGNNLWKPVSESTGTVVVLMPGGYRNADFGIYNANGTQVASVLRRHCCEHNGGRDHVYLDRTAGEPLPLTVTYDFGNGRVDCLDVGSPTSRLD